MLRYREYKVRCLFLHLEVNGKALADLKGLRNKLYGMIAEKTEGYPKIPDEITGFQYSGCSVFSLH